eukprot:c20677_g2_i2.p1 GENE.c20677_g2_i2~~c20677_g2_i2.p1  ORF type:complete len:164 (+),score=46.09 c20677_g2_i2:55-546(+)
MSRKEKGIIYRDIVSHDEMCSEANTKVVDDVMIEIMCNMIVVRKVESEQESEQKVGAKTVIDLVESHGLIETWFDKKTYIKYIKAYLKQVRSYLEKNRPERVEPFITGSMLIVKKIIANFHEYQFFMGKSQDVTGSIALVFYKDDGITPYVWLFRDGLDAEQA